MNIVFYGFNVFCEQLEGKLFFFFCVIVYQCVKIFDVQIRKVKNLAVVGHEPIISMDSIIVADTNLFYERKQCPRCHIIYRIFKNQYYPPEDEKIDSYQNIGRSNIHTLAAHPMLFSYNNVARWSFTHLQKETTTIFNESKVLIASTKLKDIRIRYQTHEPTISLNKSFLEKFKVENEDFEELIENWYIDEMR